LYPKTRGLALSASFAVVLAIFSLIIIPLPITPVPITLQVLAVFLIISLLGPYYGSLSCLVYLFFGAVNLPVFAGGTFGVASILGPLGGYLISFPIAALVGGLVSRNVPSSRKSDLYRVVASYVVALLIIYSIGSFWLMEYLHLSLVKALVSGTIPFIIIDAVKAVVATPIVVRLRASRFDLPVSRVPKMSAPLKEFPDSEM
jgi:biotin transport system substrate-specific component